MKDKKLFITIISIFTIISFIIGVSYAYFVPIIIGNDTASSHHTKAGTLRLTYNGTNVLSLPNASPGDTTSTTFTVTNNGTLPVNSYEIYFSKLTNQFINDEVVYTLTCSSSDTNNCQGKTQSPVPRIEGLVLTQNGIAPNTTHTYTLTVTFISKDEPQDYNQGKELKFTMTINEMEQAPATLIARYDAEWNEIPNQIWEYAGDITEVTFENQIDIPSNAFKSWDVSENQDGKIMAYIIDDGLGTDTYKLFIQSNQEAYANTNMIGWFSFSKYNSSTHSFESKLTKINNLNLLNTSIVTDMSDMFRGCSSLASLDLNNFNTSSVTNMSFMFDGCSSLANLDLSQFDTNNVINMDSMFSGCSSLTSLNLSSFDTSSVTDMSGMFADCSSLTSLNLSSFDTSSVTNMSGMFYECSALTSLDLSNSVVHPGVAIGSIFCNHNANLTIIVNDQVSKSLYESWKSGDGGFCPK